MRATEELPLAPPPEGSVVAIGVFDGVHRGHQHLLRCLREEARRQGCRSVVLTFREHPDLVLKPGSHVPLLLPLEERVRLLQAEGVDLVVPLTFDPALSRLTAEEFLAFLQGRLGLRGLVGGPDFALGHRREGTVPVLQRLGRERGFTLRVVEPLVVEGEMVSSTLVRRLVQEGEVERAAALLGRPFALSGRVEEGEGRGHSLGFPTANLRVDPSRLVPADGIYAAWAVVNGVRHPSATSIGVRPTFGPGPRTVEAYLLDFSGDLYGQEVRLEFARRLREERAFERVEALVAQMAEDVAQARQALDECRWMLEPAERR